VQQPRHAAAGWDNRRAEAACITRGARRRGCAAAATNPAADASEGTLVDAAMGSHYTTHQLGPVVQEGARVRAAWPTPRACR
jgi:hypothetical protein